MYFLDSTEMLDKEEQLVCIEWPERLTLNLQESWRVQLEHHIDGGRLAHVLPPLITGRNSKTSS